MIAQNGFLFGLLFVLLTVVVPSGYAATPSIFRFSFVNRYSSTIKVQRRTCYNIKNEDCKKPMITIGPHSSSKFISYPQVSSKQGVYLEWSVVVLGKNKKVSCGNVLVWEVKKLMVTMVDHVWSTRVSSIPIRKYNSCPHFMQSTSSWKPLSFQKNYKVGNKKQYDIMLFIG